MRGTLTRIGAPTALAAAVSACQWLAGINDRSEGDESSTGGTASSDDGGSGEGGSSSSGGSSGNGGTVSGGRTSSGGAQPSGGASSTGGSTSSTGGAASGGATNTGGSGGASTGGASTGGATALSATLTMTDFTIPAKTQVAKCQTFTNPFAGQTKALVKITAQSKGLASLNFKIGSDVSGSNLQDCTAPISSDFIQFSQTPNQTNDYAAFGADVGRLLPGHCLMSLSAIAYNAGSADVVASAKVTLTAVDPSSITRWVQSVFSAQNFFTLPPGDSEQAGSVQGLGGTQLLGLAGLMHHRGTNFVTSVSSKELHRTGYAAPPWWVPDPALTFAASEVLRYACSFTNETTESIRDGSSLLDDERCALFAEVATAQKPSESCL